MPLDGNELGPDVTPFEAGLGRVVKFDKPGEFVGREALAARASSGPVKHLVGLTIQSRRIARHGYPVLADGHGPVGARGSGGSPPEAEWGVVPPGRHIHRHERRPVSHPRRADRHGVPGTRCRRG